MPSYAIPEITVVQSPLNLSHIVAPGEPIYFTWPKSVTKLSINHTRMSRIQTDKAFAIVSHKTGRSSYIVGEYILSDRYIFSQEKQKIFFHEFTVDLPLTKKPTSLRLPTAVVNKMSEYSDSARELDSNMMKQLLQQENGRLTTECWQRPLQSKIVSQFASPRYLPDGRHYYHSGLDLRAQTGTPILAATNGTVSFADHMVVPGSMVILDHGGSVFSRYMHLSKINVALGEQVKKGQVIGLSGATGRVEAPHLHWEIVWKGIHADPLRFLAVADKICDQG